MHQNYIKYNAETLAGNALHYFLKTWINTI